MIETPQCLYGLPCTARIICGPGRCSRREAAAERAAMLLPAAAPTAPAQAASGGEVVDMPPLPEPDGTAEANKERHPDGGYTYDEVPAWSESLVRAYARAYSASRARDVVAFSARPLVWTLHKSGKQWTDEHHGFCIDVEPDEAEAYCASWGEGDAEQFRTLEQAMAWCQRELDAWVRRYVVTTPASAPPAGDPPAPAAAREVVLREGITSAMEALTSKDAAKQPHIMSAVAQTLLRDALTAADAQRATAPHQGDDNIEGRA